MNNGVMMSADGVSRFRDLRAHRGEKNIYIYI